MSRLRRIVTAVVAALVGLVVAFAVLGAVLSACGYGAKGTDAPSPSSVSSTDPSTVRPAEPPSEPVRTEDPQPSYSPHPTPTVTVTTTREPSDVSPTPYAYYENCDAARAAGAAPLHRGDPGYRPELDRDGDGVACEPYYR
jgi:hypothetical protein